MEKDSDEDTAFIPKESPRAPVQRTRCTCLAAPISLLLKFRSKFIVAVEPVLFLYMFGTQLQNALFQQYAYNRYGQELFREELNYTGQFNFCMNADVVDENLGNATDQLVTQKASYLSLVNSVTGQLPGVIAALLFGPLSDRIGRRPLMIVIAIAGIINAALTLLLMNLDWRVEILPAINAVNGLVGGFPGMLTIVFAYIADITSKRWLTLRLGILESMVFTGGALAVLINGQWLKASNCSFAGPMYLYLASSTSIIIYILLWLPESLTAVQRKERTKNVSFCKVATRGFRLFFMREYSRWTLWLGGLAMFIAYFVAIGITDITTLFLLGPPLSWDPGRIGLYQAMSLAMLGVTLLVVLPLLVALKIPDPLIMLIGFVWAAGSSIAVGFVQLTWEMFLIGVLSGIQGIGYAPIRSIMSKAISPKDQGALFSVVAAMQVLSSVCASVLFFFLFPWIPAHLHWPTGSIYYLIAIICSLMWPIAIVFLISWWRERSRAHHPLAETREKVARADSQVLEESAALTTSVSNALYYGSTNSQESAQSKEDRSSLRGQGAIN